MDAPRRRAAAALASLAGLLAAAGLSAGCGGDNSYVPPPPPEVVVQPPVQRPVTSYLTYTGTTRAVESVDIRARVKGFLKERKFAEGADVQKGDLLLVIDEEPFQAALEAAQAKVAEVEAAQQKAEQSKAREVAQAQLALDRAQLALARIEEARQQALIRRGAGTQEALDQATSTRKRFDAQVDADAANLEQARADYETNILAAKANVAAAKAQVRDAEINLGYCRMTAPFDGRASRGYVDPGNLVGDGTATLLATIVRSDPIYVYMTVSESDLLRFREQVRKGDRPDYRKARIPLDMGLVTEKGYPHPGRVDYTEPTVDPGTGTIVARGVFDNPTGAILPGLFARIRVALEELPDALLVPERAVGVDQGGRYLLVVDDKGVVERRGVKLGTATDDGLQVIAENLKPGELVVVEGLQRARPGAKVRPKRADEAPEAKAKAVAQARP